jgi:hypothetical protein
VTTGTPGSTASVSVSTSSTSTNKILDFIIPAGGDGKRRQYALNKYWNRHYD